MKISNDKIRKFMQSIVKEHVDKLTDEVNCTTLSEATAYHFNHDEWLDDSNHEVWGIAIQVAEAYKNKYGRK